MNLQELMAAAAKLQAARTEAAAAASGAAVTAVATGAAAAAGGAGEGATQTTEAAAAGAGAAGEKGDGAAATEATATTETAAVAAPDLSALVTKVTDLSIANVKLEAERDSYLASCAALVAIASDSLDRMSIALGGGKIDVSKMTPETLVAQHATTAATYTAKFPVGGVAAVPVTTKEDQEAQVAHEQNLFMHNQRVAAAAGSFAAKK